MTTQGNRQSAVGPVLAPATSKPSVHVPPIHQPSRAQVSYDYPFPILTPVACIKTISGRLVQFLENWKIITQDNLVLQTVSGYKISFTSPPRQWRPSITLTKSPIQTKRNGNAIQTLLVKEAIKEVPPVQDQFVSSIFLMEKDRAKEEYRPIINLKPLNRFVEQVLQNGGAPSSSLTDTVKRLYDETRSKGRLLHGSCPSRVPQISTIRVQREDVRVPMPLLWPEISPSGLHQTNDPNHNPHSELGNKSGHLPG